MNWPPEATNQSPGDVVGWLRNPAAVDGLAGCAFLIGPDLALTCAHVIGTHLKLRNPVPEEPPTDKITIQFEALRREVTGYVVPGGWFSNARPNLGEQSDIALVRLDESIQSTSSSLRLATRMPTEPHPVVIHGAEADYKSYGQQVQGRMSGANIPRGWRQIDPMNSARGFTVAAGFSGSPVLDDLGNVVFGMVVAVAEQGSGVAYAIPADNLWAALRHSDERAKKQSAGALGVIIEVLSNRIQAPKLGQPVTLDNIALMHRSFVRQDFTQKFSDGLVYYQIEIIVVGQTKILDSIESVTYRLDPAYPKSTYEIKDRQSQFKLKELANGTSIVRAEVKFIGQEHPLHLNRFIDLLSD